MSEAKFPHLQAAILRWRKSKSIVSPRTQMLAVLFSAVSFKRARSEHKRHVTYPRDKNTQANVLSALFYLL